MKKKKLRKIALWLMILSIVSVLSFLLACSLLKDFPDMDGILLIPMIGGFYGALYLFLASQSATKEKKDNDIEKQKIFESAQKAAMDIVNKDNELKRTHPESSDEEARTIKKNDNSEHKTSYQTLKSEFLHEQFYGFAPVNGNRNQDICDKFIANGIVEFENGSFDENTLNELTFDEFCHVYSTIGWFVEKIAPNLNESAISYKTFLRKKLLKRLSAFPVYTINAKVTGLPYVKQDGSLLLYTNKKMAEVTVSNSGIDWIEIFEITPQCFNAVFCEYFCTGYKAVNINGETVVKVEDIYETKPISAYGNICVESCVRMIDYKQTAAMINSKAKSENRDLNQDEIEHLNQQSYAVSVSLLKNTLCLPVKAENEMPQNIVSIVVPLVFFKDGQKFIGLFTDQGALNRYYRKSVSCVVLPDLIRDQYNEIKNDDTVSGILINPGREEYMMTKAMLSQLFN